MFSLDCAACQVLLPRHIQGGLDARLTTKLAAHLAGCANCRDEYDQLLKLANEMNSTMQALPEAPVSLWIKLEQELASTEESTNYDLFAACARLITACGVPDWSLAPLLHGLNVTRALAKYVAAA